MPRCFKRSWREQGLALVTRARDGDVLPKGESWEMEASRPALVCGQLRSPIGSGSGYIVLSATLLQDKSNIHLGQRIIHFKKFFPSPHTLSIPPIPAMGVRKLYYYLLSPLQ